MLAPIFQKLSLNKCCKHLLVDFFLNLPLIIVAYNFQNFKFNICSLGKSILFFFNDFEKKNSQGKQLISYDF